MKLVLFDDQNQEIHTWSDLSYERYGDGLKQNFTAEQVIELVDEELERRREFELEAFISE